MITYLVIGVVLASLYAIIAMSLVFVYEATGTVNFGFGALGMLAAYSYSTLASASNAWVSFLVVVTATAVVGGLVGQLSAPVRGSDQETKATASIALLIAASGLVILIWGTDSRSAPPLVSGTAFSIQGVPITWQRIVAVALAVGGCAAISGFLKRTRMGSAIRAVAVDESTAQLIGLSVNRLWVIAWAASGTLSAVALIVMLPDIGLSTGQLTYVVLVPLTAMAITNFRHPWAASGVAALLGLATALVSASSVLAPFRDAIPLCAIVAALLLTRSASSRTV